MNLHPPDGEVRLERGANGRLLASWESQGEQVSVGPPETQPAP